MKKQYVTLVLSIVLCLAFAVTASAKGKKYALFVGINNYPDPVPTLSGAVNDAKNMKALLESKYGFMAANDTILLDNQATRAAILAKLAELGAKAGAGDMLVFQYSGHGSLFPDKYSMEVDEKQKTEVHADLGNGERIDIPLDYYDSSICPWDVNGDSGYNWGNLILDDELYAIFAPLTAKGVSVVFISDSCHSGTVGKAGAVKGQVRFANPLALRKVKSFADMNLKAPAGQKTIKARQMTGNYIALSAAKDNEFAMDSDGVVAGGLFTTKLIATINANKGPLTYKRLVSLVEPVVASTSLTLNNDQHPQIDGRFGNTALTIFTLPKR